MGFYRQDYVQNLTMNTKLLKWDICIKSLKLSPWGINEFSLSNLLLIHKENTKENYNRVNYTVVKNFQKLSQLSPRFFL